MSEDHPEALEALEVLPEALEALEVLPEALEALEALEVLPEALDALEVLPEALEALEALEVLPEALPEALEEEIDEEEVNEDVDLLNRVNKKIIRNTLESIHGLRQEYAALEEKKIREIQLSIELLQNQIDTLYHVKQEILQGLRDTHIIEHETDLKMKKFIADYL